MRKGMRKNAKKIAKNLKKIQKEIGYRVLVISVNYAGYDNKYEKMTDLTGYDVRQQRIYGYLSERLLNVWVIYKNLKVYECPVVQTDKNSFDIVKGAIGTILRKAK